VITPSLLGMQSKLDSHLPPQQQQQLKNKPTSYMRQTTSLKRQTTIAMTTLRIRTSAQ
jgi:hypothetical protein